MLNVLLDAGGVILDESAQEATHAELIAAILTDHIPGYGVDDYWLDLEDAVASYCSDVYEYVLWKRVGPDIKLFEALVRQHRAAYMELMPPLQLFEPMTAEIPALAQFAQVVIAGQYGAEIIEILRERDLLPYFCSQLTQDNFSITKPDPRYFEQIARSVGAEPRDCIMVGDRIDKDVIPARLTGMRTVLIRTGIHRRQQPRIPRERPDLELTEHRGLAAAVSGLWA